MFPLRNDIHTSQCFNVLALLHVGKREATFTTIFAMLSEYIMQYSNNIKKNERKTDNATTSQRINSKIEVNDFTLGNDSAWLDI